MGLTFSLYNYQCNSCCKICFLDSGPQTELVAQLAQEFYNFDIPMHLVKNLGKLDFEVIFKLNCLLPHPCPAMHVQFVPFYMCDRISCIILKGLCYDTVYV